jgi:hypothetical protein
LGACRAASWPWTGLARLAWDDISAFAALILLFQLACGDLAAVIQMLV